MPASQEQSPKGISRRKFFKYGLFGGGGLLMSAAATYGAFFRNPPVEQIERNTTGKYPPQEVQKAEQEIASFEEAQRRAAIEGQYGQSLKDAYALRKRYLADASRRDELTENEHTKNAAIVVGVGAVGLGTIFTGASLTDPRPQKPSESGNLLPQSPSKGASSA